MNITVNSTAFVQELRLLNHVAPVKPTLPILANLRLHADDGYLHLFATDLEIGFETLCRATIAEPGMITLPVKRLLDLVEQLPDIDVQIVSDPASVRLSAGAFKSRLQTLTIDDFPTVPHVSGELLTLSLSDVRRMIQSVHYAISAKTKYQLNGALCVLQSNVVALVATDGKRLALTTLAHEHALTEQIIIPKATLDAIVALFVDENELMISQTDRHLFFVASDRTLVSRKMEGKFPAYERIIPRSHDKKAFIDRALFAAALRRVGLLADTNQSVYCLFEPKALTITSSSAEAGDALERLSVMYEGEPLKFCVSWQYLLDFLNAAEGSVVTLECHDAKTPLLLSDGASFINVVMLMKER